MIFVFCMPRLNFPLADIFYYNLDIFSVAIDTWVVTEYPFSKNNNKG